MADSTALVAGITGISTLLAGIGGGWVSAHQQSETARRQLDADREKAERQREEEALDRRLENYRDFLDVERQLRRLVSSNQSSPSTDSDFYEWLASFNRAYNLLVLTGTDEARRGAEEVFNRLGEMDRDRLADQSASSFSEKLVNAYARHDAELRKIRDELIQTMREDVAPHGPQWAAERLAARERQSPAD
jgi:hypothetical protein